MALVYDEAIFQEFRKKAITEVEKLEIGKTYWSNNRFTGEVQLVSIMDDIELRAFRDEEVTCRDVSGTKRWMGFSNGKYRSLMDMNIGNSYNPWLIFDNEKDALECVEKLKVTYIPECFD